MDREISLEETMKIRKAVIPMLIDALKEIKISDNRQNVIQIDTEEIKKALIEAISNINLPEYPSNIQITNQKDIQKVEVVNQEYPEFPTFPEIKIEKTEVNFPEIQKVVGEIKAVNLPVGEDKEASKKANPTNYLIVRLSDGQKFIDGLGGGATSVPMGRSTENIYLREEYSYTTVSGSQVPVMVKKWTDNMVLTENYEYDSNANPIKKFRSIEPYNA